MNPLPAAEYCFLWIDWWPMCMTKAEWSGWAQAVGSFMALLLAIVLAGKARRDARIDATEAAIRFVAGVIHSLDEAENACAVQNWETFKAARLLVRDAALAGDFLNAQAPTPGVMPSVMAVRAIAAEAFYMSEGHVATGNWGHWREHFRASASGARVLLKKIKDLGR